MKTTTSVQATFECSLERAFKTPILGDATKYLVGYGPIPATVGFTEDSSWGKVGGSRIPHSARSLMSKGGPVGHDEIWVREENRYWKWAVTDFTQWSLGFTKFQGELFFTPNEDGTIHVKWVYSLFSKGLLAPFQWLFVKVLWHGQMKVAIQNMKIFAESDAPFLYE